MAKRRIRDLEVAIVPAVLYYVALYASVHFQAQKLGLRYSTATPKEVFINLGKLLRSRGYLLIPIFILISKKMPGFEGTAVVTAGAVENVRLLDKSLRAMLLFMKDRTRTRRN